MNDQEKIVILEKNIAFKFKDITDFDITKCVTEYVEKVGGMKIKVKPKRLLIVHRG